MREKWNFVAILFFFFLGVSNVLAQAPKSDFQLIIADASKTMKSSGKHQLDSMQTVLRNLLGETKNPKEKIDVYIYLSQLSMFKSEYDSAFEYVQSIEKELNELSGVYHKGEYNYWIRKGAIESRRLSFNTALFDYNEALKHVSSPHEEAMVQTSIGNVYGNLKNLDKKLEVLKKAYKIWENESIPKRQSDIARRIATIYNELLDFNSADYWIEIAENLPRSDINTALLKLMKINVLLKKGLNKEAEKALVDISGQILNRVTKKEILASYWTKVGNVLSRINSPELSKITGKISYEAALEKALSYNAKTKTVHKIIWLNNIADLYASNGRFDKAFELQKLSSELKKNVYDKARLKGFQAEKNLIEKKAQLEKTAAENELKHYRYLITLITLILTILVLSIYLIVKSKRKLQILNVNLEQKNDEISEKNNLVTKQLKTILAQEKSLNDIKSEWLKIVENKILEHLKGINIKMIAELLKISERSVHRKMKEISGFTPEQFIKEIRLKRALKILNETPGITVSEVAYEVGFENVSHFSTSFKKRFDKSPSEIIV